MREGLEYESDPFGLLFEFELFLVLLLEMWCEVTFQDVWEWLEKKKRVVLSDEKMVCFF